MCRCQSLLCRCLLQRVRRWQAGPWYLYRSLWWLEHRNLTMSVIAVLWGGRRDRSRGRGTGERGRRAAMGRNENEDTYRWWCWRRSLQSLWTAAGCSGRSQCCRSRRTTWWARSMSMSSMTIEWRRCMPDSGRDARRWAGWREGATGGGLGLGWSGGRVGKRKEAWPYAWWWMREKKSKEALERATEPGWKGQERAIRSIKKSSRARARADKTVDSREERAPGQELAAEGTL